MENVKNTFTSGLSSLAKSISNIVTTIIELPQKIIDLIIEALKNLFIPKNFSFDDILLKFNNKYPIITQIADIATGLFNGYGDTDIEPLFIINYKGVSYKIIDFDWYANYRMGVKAIMACLAWLYFVKWVIHFIPKLLGGIN